MFNDVIEKVSNSANAKSSLLKKSKGKYLVSSALAGMFVGFGIILIFTIGGVLSSVNSASTKIVMGLSFGVALSLVIMAGSELFTGNNMVMTIGALEKKVTIGDTLNIWIFSFIGNLIGSILLAYMYSKSGKLLPSSWASCSRTLGGTFRRLVTLNLRQRREFLQRASMSCVRTCVSVLSGILPI